MPLRRIRDGENDSDPFDERIRKFLRLEVAFESRSDYRVSPEGIEERVD